MQLPAALMAQGLHLVSVETSTDTTRNTARQLIRHTLQEKLAELLTVNGEKPLIFSSPGQAPRLNPPWEKIGLSISHEPGLSLGVINLKGPVGIDLLGPVRISNEEIARLACDYLSPSVARQITGQARALQQIAFAEAWTAHEASLKCLNHALTEWTPSLGATLASCRVSQLEMPSGWAAALVQPGV